MKRIYTTLRGSQISKLAKPMISSFFAFLLLFSTAPSYAFTLDPSVNGDVEVVLPLADGKTIIAGNFTNVAGVFRGRIARLNEDGSLDISFNPASGPSARILDMALQEDGKILIVGDFVVVNGVPRNRIARLNADGSLDQSFLPGSGADARISTVALQSNGQVIIGGNFTSYNGTPQNRIARLFENGSLDSAFNVGAGASGSVLDLVVQSDDAVLMAGAFFTVNGLLRRRIARLTIDGIVDESFDPGLSANQPIETMVLQDDGAVVIGGAFTQFTQFNRRGIARITSAGVLDQSFNPGAGVSGSVDALLLQADAKILIGGSFSAFNGTFITNLARLTDVGSLDQSFDPGDGPSDTVRSIGLQEDGRVVIGGEFSLVDSIVRRRVARLESNGQLEGKRDDFESGAAIFLILDDE